jgi:hypothetical protein
VLTWEHTGHFLGGLVAGEGSYIETTTGASFVGGEPRKRFIFSLTLASWDRRVVHALRSFLGVGGVYDTTAPHAHWQPTTTLRVQSHMANRRVVIPFSDRFLPPSHKRVQFERWRAAFDDYEQRHPNRWGQGPSTCSEPGCGGPVRGRGLCRSHYYHVTGY